MTRSLNKLDKAPSEQGTSPVQPRETIESSSLFSQYLYEVRLEGVMEPSKTLNKMSEIFIARKLKKILKFYEGLFSERSDVSMGILDFTGNILVNKFFQGRKFFIKVLSSIDVARVFRVYEIRLESIILNFKEFSGMIDEFFNYLRLLGPAIFVVYSIDLFFRRFENKKINFQYNKTIIRFLDFIKNKDLSREKFITIGLVDDVSILNSSFLSSMDFILDFQVPTKDERVLFLKMMLEDHEDLKYVIIANEMKGWTWGDLELFMKRLMLERQLNPDVPISTRFILDIIQGTNNVEKFIPFWKELGDHKVSDYRFIFNKDSGTVGEQSPGIKKGDDKSSPAAGVGKGSKPIHDSRDPFIEQLWQDAASRHYKDLLLALDRLEKGTILPEDRVLFSLYPFILQDEPFDAKRKLEYAKKRIEMVTKIFSTKG
ncbi:MAG: hypothetical protein ACTSXP_19725 [Promethearchaeota archaeon]